jgi:hypothetical protein
MEESFCRLDRREGEASDTPPSRQLPLAGTLTSSITLYNARSLALILNVDGLVSTLAPMSPCQRQATTRAFGMTIQLSARAMHSVKRLHASRANGSVRTAVETRRHCSVLFRPRSWLRSGCGYRCCCPVRRDLHAPTQAILPRPLNHASFNPACFCMSQSSSSHHKRRILYESPQLSALCAVITTFYLLNA